MSSYNLKRLLQPKSIALFGGLWVENVATQIKNSSFNGDVWPINPRRKFIAGFKCFKDISQLPGIPDAAFIGVNRNKTLEILEKLDGIGCGGATCFAAGFSEVDNYGKKLQKKLSKASKNMPFLGPNCYGFLNYLDHVYMWPDQHGGKELKKGVAIIAQSSNIAINLTMNTRSTPIAYILTTGNQEKIDVSDLGLAMISDKRVSAIGMYVEGFKDIEKFEKMAFVALQHNIPIIVLKSGKTDLSKKQSFSHTASITGDSDISSAFLKRLGIVEVDDLELFLESLKVLNFNGRLEKNTIVSVSCSGGEASLVSDISENMSLKFPKFSNEKSGKIRNTLGELVTISNPLDYHTFIWGDQKKMNELFITICENIKDFVLFVFDVPRSDRCDPSSFNCGIEAIINAKKKTNARIAVIASIAESMTEELAEIFIKNKILPLGGLKTGLKALEMSHKSYLFSMQVDRTKVLLKKRTSQHNKRFLLEIDSKIMLKKFGVPVPKSLVTSKSILNKNNYSINKLRFPIVLKGTGSNHKTENGLVFLNIKSKEELINIQKKLNKIKGDILIEEMIGPISLELLIGITKDETGLFALTIAKGGIYSELFSKTINSRELIVLPTSKKSIKQALKSLAIYPIFQGYRGLPKANLKKTIEVIMKISSLIEENNKNIEEIEINPLIITPKNAYAADALISIQSNS